MEHRDISGNFMLLYVSRMCQLGSKFGKSAVYTDCVHTTVKTFLATASKTVKQTVILSVVR